MFSNRLTNGPSLRPLSQASLMQLLATFTAGRCREGIAVGYRVESVGVAGEVPAGVPVGMGLANGGDDMASRTHAKSLWRFLSGAELGPSIDSHPVLLFIFK